MDSKKKFIKNRYWKRRKYHPQSCINKKALESKNEKSNQSTDESDNEFVLKQPIPKEGWFPEYDTSSSSDSEDLKSLINVKNFVPSTNSSNDLGNDKILDKNWFEKELDNIQYSAESLAIKETNIKDEKENFTSKETVKQAAQISDFKIQNNAVKKSIEKNSNNSIDNDKELDILLSLKGPTHTGPIIGKNCIENDRRLTTSSNSYLEQKPIKTIDLEKWLDSVLDS